MQAGDEREPAVTRIVVDKQLLVFRGRYGFRMYIPNNPAKHRIKLIMACDAQSNFMLNAIP